MSFNLQTEIVFLSDYSGLKEEQDAMSGYYSATILYHQCTVINFTRLMTMNPRPLFLGTLKSAGKITSLMKEQNSRISFGIDITLQNGVNQFGSFLERIKFAERVLPCQVLPH